MLSNENRLCPIRSALSGLVGANRLTQYDELLFVRVPVITEEFMKVNDFPRRSVFCPK